MRASRCTITIVLVGRTGVGKSSLGNKLAGKTIFPEGNTLLSETTDVTAHNIQWPGDACTDVTIIDTPGFADNSMTMSNSELLSKILSFLDSLKGGLNIVLFCLDSKTRIDSYDIKELEMLGLLLGQGIFEHIYVTVTKSNTHIDEFRENVYRNFKADLPRILMQHHLPIISDDKILFADFDKFEDQFIVPLNKVLYTSTKYQVKLAEGVDSQDPDSIEKLLMSPEVKRLTEMYEKMMEQQKKEAESMKNILDAQVKQTEDLRKKYQEDAENYRKNLEMVNQVLDSQKVENERTREQYQTFQTQQAQQLEFVQQALNRVSEQNELAKRQSEQKDKLIDNLNDKLNELINRPPVVIRGDRGGGGGFCNIF